MNRISVFLNAQILFLSILVFTCTDLERRFGFRLLILIGAKQAANITDGGSGLGPGTQNLIYPEAHAR